LEADHSAATRPFTVPAEWRPIEGSLVKLKPGLAGDDRLQAGELAVISSFLDFDGEMRVERVRDGEMLLFSSSVSGCRTDCCTSYSNDFAHGFDGWLPAQAASALGLDAVAEVLAKSTPEIAGRL